MTDVKNSEDIKDSKVVKDKIGNSSCEEADLLNKLIDRGKVQVDGVTDNPGATHILDRDGNFKRINFTKE